jgi:hypothetical protein
VHVPVTGRRGVATIATVLATLACAAVAGAAPALAVDDPTRPDARVTHGPSCRPGGVVVEVTAGTVGHAVTLATTRAPKGEDAAEVLPGAVVVLRTAEVAWGETIDPRLRYRALDGSGTSWVDELEGYSFTRPAEEDCAAITPPPGAGTVPALSPPAPDAGAVPMPVADSPGEPATVAPAAADLAVAGLSTAVTTEAPEPLWPLLGAFAALLAGAGGMGALATRRHRAPAAPVPGGPGAPGGA